MRNELVKWQYVIKEGSQKSRCLILDGSVIFSVGLGFMTSYVEKLQIVCVPLS